MVEMELVTTEEATEVEEKDRITDRILPLSFTKDRHVEPIEGISCITQTWRMKERMKTVSVALVLCLNVGVDPPDVMKTSPCARLECWIDPMSLPPAKALDQIGAALQAQYERWQPRARYKQSPDPTTEDVRKLCTSLRRNAKEERVLFHYNGHGVPKPTTNGEIWVFNRTYTQYIPMSVFDLQSWMGSPSIYVYDCSNAGIIVESFRRFAIQHENEYEQNKGRSTSPGPPPCYRNCIQLAACSKDQVLPMNPDLPADLFTSCLTTPIKIALRWYVLQPTSKLVPKVNLDLIDKIPGQITDRRTMLGELNWIFTAITDTIAWNTLPRDLFQKLFRQDLLVASLFRNFLLAERIMRSCDCTPVSSPPLPPTAQHPMWNAWDLALDLSLGQLPRILSNDEPFVHLPFFEEQLTAFQVWLELGSEERSPPEQLPIVLQVLLSQVHRMRALELLGKFLDLGPWAVNLALSVGIFPYVLKLLQSCAKELRPLLVFIWAKILAVDNTCQADLVRDNGHKYFLSVLQDMTISNDHRTQAAFVLACIVNNFRDGQEAALQGSLVSICLEQLSDPSPHLRQWVAICLGRLWDHYEKARWTGVRDIAHEKLYTLLHDSCAEVRAAAVYALGTFINSVTERSEHANTIDHSVVMTLVNNVSSDMSSLVRCELVKALQWVVLAFEHAFINVARQEGLGYNIGQDVNRTPTAMRRIGSRIMSPSSSHSIGIDSLDSSEHLKRVASSSSISGIGHGSITHGHHSGSLGTLPGLAYGSVYMKIWNALCVLEADPHPNVARMCAKITGHVRRQLKDQGQRESGDSRLCNSISLPPSPNRGNYLASESPPTLHPSNYKINMRGGTFPSCTRKLHQNTINEEDDKDSHLRRPMSTPLVTTNFVEWSCKRFAQPVNAKNKLEDIESGLFYEREWRYLRNNNVRKEAEFEQHTILVRKLEYPACTVKCTVFPCVLQFHPFEQQIALAGNDTFFIVDWGTGAKLTQCQCKSVKNVTSRITAMEWINAHDLALVMTASDDGSVRLWKPHSQSTGSKDATLVSAWQAFSDVSYSKYKTGKGGDMVLAWEQWTQTVITTGDSRLIRFWDAESELKSFDIPTGTDHSVTCLDSTYAGIAHERQSRHAVSTERSDEGLVMGSSDDDDFNSNYHGPRSGLVVIGCADGSVRVFDRRCSPSDARVKIWMEHGAPCLDVQLRGNEIISGSTHGDVRIYDIRKSDSIQVNHIFKSSPMSSFAVHGSARIYACGSAQQNVVINTFSGDLINYLRYYEGFMGFRTGPVLGLAFHPHKMALATGMGDSTLVVYTPESRR